MNPIGWCDITINPITGCLNDCDYCYARKMAYRLKGRCGYPEDAPFKPTFHPNKLHEIYNLRGAHKRVFLDSMGDWFSEGVEAGWIRQTTEAVASRPNHTFMVLTKRPDRILEMLRCLTLPKNLWFGVSVTNNSDLWRIAELVSALPETQHKFVSFEPLLSRIHPDLLTLKNIKWVIIGAESGNRKCKVKPAPAWMKTIFDRVPNEPWPNRPSIFMKDNLMPYLPYWSQLKEFPPEMV